TVKRRQTEITGVIRGQGVDVRQEKVFFYDMGGNLKREVELKYQAGLDVKTYSTYGKGLCYADDGIYIFDFSKQVVYFYNGEDEMLTPKYTLASNISKPDRIMKTNNGFYFYYSRGELYKVD
ncbi:MAG: hypothetical protein MJ124_09750, partial [Lachnospiraceae bacterium]|nr:hypothetical protein [Lachnospiraceae bacterium]